MAKYEPVIFENSLGEVISNDPVYLAQRTLAAYDIDPVTGEKPAPKKAKKAVEAPAAEEVEDDEDIESEDEESEDEEVEEDTPRDYTELDGKAVSALAKERGVDVTGLTKVKEVRAALMADDAAKAAATAE